MRTIAKLFGHSPFVPLQGHMAKVAACIHLIRPATEAFLVGDQEKVSKLAEQVSTLEHAADEAKYDIKNGVRKGLFMPVERARLLEIASIQDALADKAENYVVLLTLKSMVAPPAFVDDFKAFLDKNLEAFEAVYEIVHQFDELLESSFGGVEAQRVSQMVHHVAVIEHEADLIQRTLLKHLFGCEQELTHGEFFLWMQIFRQIGELANISESLANKIRSILELK
jgi:predicted phosphate transport protein (TIGR00153 family)